MSVNKKFELFDEYTQNAIINFIHAMDKVFPNLFSHEELLVRCVNNLDGNIEFKNIPGAKGVYDLDDGKIYISPVLLNTPLYEKLVLFHEFIHVITKDLIIEKNQLCGLFELFTTLCEERYYEVLTGRKNVRKVNGYIVELARPFEEVYGDVFLHSFLKGDTNLQDFIYADPLVASIPIEKMSNVYRRKTLNKIALCCDDITSHLLRVPTNKLDDSKIAESVYSLETLFLEQLNFKFDGLESKEFLESLNKLYSKFRFPNDLYVISMIRKYYSSYSDEEILSILAPYKEIHDLFQLSNLSLDEIKNLYNNREGVFMEDSLTFDKEINYRDILNALTNEINDEYNSSRHNIFSSKMLFSLYLRFSGVDLSDIRYSFNCGDIEKYSLLFEQKKHLNTIVELLLTDNIKFDKDSNYKIFFNQKRSNKESINLQQGNTKDSLVLGFFDNLFAEASKIDFLIYNTDSKKIEFIHSDILFSRVNLEDVMNSAKSCSVIVKELFRYISSLNLNQPFFNNGSINSSEVEASIFEYPFSFFDILPDGKIKYYEVSYDKERNIFTHEEFYSKFRYGKSLSFHLSCEKEKIV